MTHKLLILIICALTLASCNDQPKQDVKISLRDSWYRHYTGTIAGKQVHVNLHCSNSEIMGFYSYDERKIPIALYDEDENPAKSGNSVNLTEHAITEVVDSDEHLAGAHWMIDISTEKVKGKWISDDGSKTYDIVLEESYPRGVNVFDILRVDTAAGKGTTTIISSDVIALPAFESPVLDSAIAGRLGCSTTEPYRECLLAKAGEYFAGHMDKTDSTGDADKPHYYESKAGAYVLYNRRNIVVMVFRGHINVDYAHGKYSSTYLCADVQDERLWQLQDILDVDTPRLISVIAGAARKVYNIGPNEPLTSKLRVASIPVTDNIYFTGSGIAFNYGPNEIVSGDDKETSLFIPFAKLRDMLKPEFKTRMGLK